MANTGVGGLSSNIHSIVITAVGYTSTVYYGQQGSSIMAAAYGGDVNHKEMVWCNTVK